jgi:hypothetical protein
MKRFAALSVCSLALFAGCAAPDDSNVDSSGSQVVSIPQSNVKNQAIGNCWLYAMGSWAEGLHKAQANETLSMSESYWSYWDWYDHLVNGEVSGTSLATGGGFERAAYLIERYGIMMEPDFIAADAQSETQNSQQKALDAINASLAAGALKDPMSRTDSALVRSELNKAWALDPSVVADLDATFGPGGNNSGANAVHGAGSKVHWASEYSVKSMKDAQGNDKTLTLADFIGTGDQYSRQGDFAWQSVGYSDDATARRATQIRMQKAMNDGWDVMISWYVDFNALDKTGHFTAPPAKPGPQGGHMTVLEDYEITDVPGFGTLPAGTVETRPEALAASLDPSAKISFLRTKNSWGTYESLATMPGYFDIYEAYFDGPIQVCQTDAQENPILSTCNPQTPLEQFVLPPGY